MSTILKSKLVNPAMVQEKVCPFCGNPKRKGTYSCEICRDEVGGENNAGAANLVRRVLEGFQKVETSRQRQPEKIVVRVKPFLAYVWIDPEAKPHNTLPFLRSRFYLQQGKQQKGHMKLDLHGGDIHDRGRSVCAIVEVKLIAEEGREQYYLRAQKIDGVECDTELNIDWMGTENSLLDPEFPNGRFVWDTEVERKGVNKTREFDVMIGFRPVELTATA